MDYGTSSHFGIPCRISDHISAVHLAATAYYRVLVRRLQREIQADGNHRRPYDQFRFLTLALSYLVRIFHFNPNVLRIVAVIVIGILGLTMVVRSFPRRLKAFSVE